MFKKTLFIIVALAVVAPAFGQAALPTNLDGTQPTVESNQLIAPGPKVQKINNKVVAPASPKTSVRPQPAVQSVRQGEDPQVIIAPGVNVQREIKRNTLRVNFTAQKEVRRVEAETRRDVFEAKIQAKRATLKERLKNVNNADKVKVVERIDENIENLNDRIIKKYEAFLARLESVLARIADKTDEVEVDGVDVTAVRIAITAASEAIASAYVAVDAQGVKVYELIVDTEDNLGEVVSAVRLQLRDDLKNIREIIRVAAVEVRKAGQALRGVLVINQPEETGVEE